MNQEESFTELLRVIEQPLIKLNDMLRSHSMTLQKVKWDIDNKQEQLAKVKVELDAYESKVKATKSEIEKMHENGKLALKVNEQVSQDKILQSTKLLAEVKEFVKEVDRQKYKELLNKVQSSVDSKDSGDKAESKPKAK